MLLDYVASHRHLIVCLAGLPGSDRDEGHGGQPTEHRRDGLLLRATKARTSRTPTRPEIFGFKVDSTGNALVSS